MRELEPRPRTFRNQLPSNGRIERTCGEAVFQPPFALYLKDFAGLFAPFGPYRAQIDARQLL
jgi:hypothetical protein